MNINQEQNQCHRNHIKQEWQSGQPCNWEWNPINNNCGAYECNQKGCNNFGSSNRIKYDSCEYQKSLYESTKPLSYYIYEPKYESQTKCVHDKFYRKYDLVDVESELRNITRPMSKCSQYKYNPNCKKNESCTSTFDNTVPIVMAPELCPIVKNNIPKTTNPGYSIPNENICATPNLLR